MDNEQQRDHAEESANRALLREGDVGPFGSIDKAAILRRSVDSLLDSGAPATAATTAEAATATTGATGPVYMDWTAAEADTELADGFCWLAGYNLGAPWATVVMALDRTTRRGFVDRGAFEAELRLLIRQAGEFGIANG